MVHPKVVQFYNVLVDVDTALANGVAAGNRAKSESSRNEDSLNVVELDDEREESEYMYA